MTDLTPLTSVEREQWTDKAQRAMQDALTAMTQDGWEAVRMPDQDMVLWRHPAEPNKLFRVVVGLDETGIVEEIGLEDGQPAKRTNGVVEPPMDLTTAALRLANGKRDKASRAAAKPVAPRSMEFHLQIEGDQAGHEAWNNGVSGLFLEIAKMLPRFFGDLGEANTQVAAMGSIRDDRAMADQAEAAAQNATDESDEDSERPAFKALLRQVIGMMLLGMDGIDQVLAEGVAGLTSTEFAKLNIAIAKTVQYWRLPPDSVPPPPDLSDLWQPIETAPVAEWVLVRSQSRCWVAVQPRDGVGWYDVDTRSQEPIEWRPLPPGGMRMGDGEGEV